MINKRTMETTFAPEVSRRARNGREIIKTRTYGMGFPAVVELFQENDVRGGTEAGNRASCSRPYFSGSHRIGQVRAVGYCHPLPSVAIDCVYVILHK